LDTSVTLSVPVAVAAIGVTATALLALSERRKLRASRASILDPVKDHFTNAKLTFDGAGFPKLEGTLDGHQMRLELIPDTMTIRRLPQLWLSMTDVVDLPIAGRGVAILIRPSGADYYSLTEHMRIRLDVPPAFPWECIVKGETSESSHTLDLVAKSAAKLLADPRMKEVAVTSRGVRIIRQLAEGKRGDHLLLRQSAFTGAEVTPRDITEISAGLSELRAALMQNESGKTNAA
jgi:hypothetical protein